MDIDAQQMEIPTLNETLKQEKIEDIFNSINQKKFLIEFHKKLKGLSKDTKSEELIKLIVKIHE